MNTKLTLIFSTIVLALIMMSFGIKNIDESTYSSKYIKYSVERDGSTALLKVAITDVSQYDEVYLRRSVNPTEDFRQVKYISKSQLESLAASGTIVDKYPLPGNVDTYYKVVAISNEGVYKLFPCVKLSKYQ